MVLQKRKRSRWELVGPLGFFTGMCSAQWQQNLSQLKNLLDTNARCHSRDISLQSTATV